MTSEVGQEDSDGELGVQREGASSAQPAPKRIIYMIGDGMGVAALTATTYAYGAPLEMFGMDEMGLITTHSYDFSTTDSAAAAAALATGQKTHFEAVSVKPGTPEAEEEAVENHLETILEKAHRVGWKTGLVATVRINHATPGAFAGHRNERHSYEGIAADMSKSGVDVLIGGGRKYFDQRSDKKDLMAGFKEAGYTVLDEDEELAQAASSAQRLVAISQETDLPPADDPARKWSLSEMTSAAFEVLDRDNDEGFFLMVEGSQIDWRAHAMDGLGVVSETVEFDQAIRTALEYAASREDTLVVVTADHETGGMTVLDSAQADEVLGRLGGHEKATQRVKRSKKAEEKFPSAELLPTIEIGDYAAANRESAGDESRDSHDDPLGLQTLSGQSGSQIRPDFGFISVESRAICPSTGRFGAIHTSEMVPVFAQGSGAKWVAESRDNAVLGARLVALVGADAVPASSDKLVVEQAQIQARESAKGSAEPAVENAGQTPNNIILMIGDGMGIPALTAGYYGRGPLHMQTMPIQGLVATHALDRLASDAAAAATALATGQRTRRGAVGMVPDGDGWAPATSILELAEQQGMKTGIVSTNSAADPVTAAFYAHFPSLKNRDGVVDALVNFAGEVEGSDGIDVVYAGGAKDFRKVKRDILRKEFEIIASDKWHDSAQDESKQDDSEQDGQASDEAFERVARFIAPNELAPASQRLAQEDPEAPALASMTRRALAHLSDQAYRADDSQGFVLVVNGSQIARAQASLAREQDLVDEMADFDQAVGAALDFARRDGDTLVVVTGTHDYTTAVVDQHYGHNACQRAVLKEFEGDFELVDIPVEPASLGPSCQSRSTENLPVIEMADAKSKEPNSDSEGACFGDDALRARLQGEFAPIQFSIQHAWSVTAAQRASREGLSDASTANFVPLFAFGPGAGHFTGFRDQPQVGQTLQGFVSAR